jgi:hypothetical protein
MPSSPRTSERRSRDPPDHAELIADAGIPRHHLRDDAGAIRRRAEQVGDELVAEAGRDLGESLPPSLKIDRNGELRVIEP